MSAAYQPLVFQTCLVAYNGCSYAYIQRIAERNSGKRFAFVECQRRISPLFLRLALPNGNRYAPGLVNAVLSDRFAVFARRHCETATHLGARDFRMILCETERRQYGVLSSEDCAKAPKRPVPRRCLSVFVRLRLTTVAATPTFNESRSGTAESALPSLNVSGVSAPYF